MKTKKKKQKYEGGATRSVQDINYELIPKAALDALGRRLTLGMPKHGRDNWRKGGVEFVNATISHLQQHLADYVENGNANDGNTDAIICNAAFLCFYELKYPRKKKP